MRALVIAIAFSLIQGCAASAAVAPEAQSADTAKVSEPAQPAADDGAQAKTAPAPDPAAHAALQPLPQSLNAGSITRADLAQVLAEGVGRFLQKVSMAPHRPQGRFEGWVLRSIFDNQPQWQAGCVLRPGDVVLRVNNQSVERPEQFMAVWQSLASAGEIAIDVVRDGHDSRVRYLIVD